MSSNSVLSFEDWLITEYDIDTSDYKKYSKYEKNSLKDEYNQYVESATSSNKI